MSLPIYQRVAVTDTGDVIPGAEYTVINENTGVAQPIYSDRTGATLLTPPYFADSVGTIQFFIAQGTTFRVAASGGVGTYTDRYVYGVAEAVLVQADGNVGISTSFPDADLHVVPAEADINNPFSGIRVSRTPSLKTSQYGNMSFANGALSLTSTVSGAGGQIKFLTSTNGTSASETMRIDSAGNLLVGTTNDQAGISNTSTGHSIAGNGYATHSRTGATPLYLNRNTSDGELLSLRKDGTIVGSIGSSNNAERLYITNDSTGLSFLGDFSRINPCDSAGTARDNAIDLGQSTARFKNLYLSGIVDIGGFATTGTVDGVQINGDGSGIQSKAGSTGFSYHNRFYNSGGQVGYISTVNSSTQYITSSDYRLKENDVLMTGATERVKALRPINFAWKVDGLRVDGFFAHELQEIVPEAATGTKDAMMDEEYEVTPAVYEDVIIPAVKAAEAVLDEDGVVITEAVEAIAESTESVLVTEAVMGTRSVPDYQGIDQSKLVPLLTATIQELIARIEALEAGA